MRGIWSVLVLVCMACAFGQQQGLKKEANATGVSWDPSPVTRGEARAVFTEVRQILNRVLNTSIPASPRIPSGSAPVTREQIVSEMTQDWGLVAGKAKFAPNPTPIEASVLKIAPAERAHLIGLIKLGLVGKVSPLATGPTDTMDAKDLGDAVGFYLSRIAQVTHMPDPKWSPIISNPNGA
jgi:hypothetical protein